MRVRNHVLVPLLLCAVAFLLATPARAVASQSNKGRAILERTAGFYRGLSSARATVESTFRLPDGQVWGGGGTFTLSLSRPRSLSVISPDTPDAPRFVQNDEQRYAEQPFLESYFLGDSRSFDDLLAPTAEPMLEHGPPVFPVVILWQLVFGSPPAAQQVEYLGDEKADGVRCRHLALSLRTGRVEIWVAKGKESWLIRYRQYVTMTRAGRPLPETYDAASATDIYEYSFRDWDAAPDLAGAFTIAPREGFERVESLPMVRPRRPEPAGSSDAAEVRLVSAGDPAPGVRFLPVDGEPVDLSDLRGKVVVLDFWATWCAPCIADLPRVREATARFPEEDVILLAVNSGEPERIVRDFLARRGLDLPVVLDADATVSSAFGVSSLPCLVLIDRTGTVRRVFKGSHRDTARDLRTEIRKLLAD